MQKQAKKAGLGITSDGNALTAEQLEEEKRIAIEKAEEEEEEEAKKKAEEKKLIQSDLQQKFNDAVKIINDQLNTGKVDFDTILGKLIVAYISVTSGVVDKEEYISILKNFYKNHKNNWKLFLYGLMVKEFNIDNIEVQLNPSRFNYVWNVFTANFTGSDGTQYAYYSLYSVYKKGDANEHKEGLKNKLLEIK